MLVSTAHLPYDVQDDVRREDALMYGPHVDRTINKKTNKAPLRSDAASQKDRVTFVSLSRMDDDFGVMPNFGEFATEADSRKTDRQRKQEYMVAYIDVVLGKLDLAERQIVGMYFYDGMKARDIQDGLGVPIDEVRRRLIAAVRKMRKIAAEVTGVTIH